MVDGTGTYKNQKSTNVILQITKFVKNPGAFTFYDKKPVMRGNEETVRISKFELFIYQVANTFSG